MDKGMRCMLFHSSTVCVCVRVSWLIVHGKTGVVIMYIIGKVTLCVTTITARASEMNHETAILPRNISLGNIPAIESIHPDCVYKITRKMHNVSSVGFGLCSVCHKKEAYI